MDIDNYLKKCKEQIPENQIISQAIVYQRFAIQPFLSQFNENLAKLSQILPIEQASLQIQDIEAQTFLYFNTHISCTFGSKLFDLILEYPDSYNSICALKETVDHCNMVHQIVSPSLFPFFSRSMNLETL